MATLPETSLLGIDTINHPDNRGIGRGEVLGRTEGDGGLGSGDIKDRVAGARIARIESGGRPFLRTAVRMEGLDEQHPLAFDRRIFLRRPDAPDDMPQVHAGSGS